MTEEDVKKIIREELEELLGSDRYTFHKTIQILEGRNIQLGLNNGTKIGTAPEQKIGFWGADPVVQFNSTGETTGYDDAPGGLTVYHRGTFTGNYGSNAYTINDIVKALKKNGTLES